MKKLIIASHGKTYLPSGVNEDFLREISNKGEVELEQRAMQLTKINTYPEALYSSTLKRAKQSVKSLNKIFCLDQKNIHYIKDVFDRNYEYLGELIFGTSNTLSTLMILGHDPQVSDFLTSLTQKSFSLQMGDIVYLEIGTNKWEEIYTSKIQRIIHLTD